MSVINQMLKDLESRDDGHIPAIELLDGQPVARRGRPRHKFLLLALILLLPLLGYLAWDQLGSSATVSAAAEASVVPSQTLTVAAGNHPLPAATIEHSPNAAPPEQKPLVSPAAPTTVPLPESRLLSLTPRQLTGSWDKQRLILKGENLQPDSRVLVAWDDRKKLLPPERVYWRDSTTLEVEIVTGTNAGQWKVSLLDSQDKTLRLTVAAPEATAPSSPQAKVIQAEEQGTTPESAIEKHIRPLRPEQRAQGAYQEGYRQLQRGERDSAEANWRQALELDPRHIASREGLAGLYLNQGRNVEAGEVLAEGLAHHPGHGQFALLYARLQLENGQSQLALATLEKALAAQAQGADFLAFLAALYQREKSFDKSVAAYQRALSLQPRNALWWMGIGISLEGAGKVQEAISAYKEAGNSGKLPPRLAQYVDGRLAALE